MTRRTKIKGFKVTRTGDTVRLEPIPYFKMSASQKVAARKSKAVRVTRRAPG